MTDKRIKMECPFCHEPAENIQIWIPQRVKGQPPYGRIYCPNPNCQAGIGGQLSVQELISRWNRR